MKVSIFDLDNCISNDSWRKDIIDFKNEAAHNERWHEYHSLSNLDKYENSHMVDQEADEDNKIVIITGRPERYRNQTIGWLNAHSINYFSLLMRDNKDKRSSVEVKKALVKAFIIDNHPVDVQVAYDDRQDIVDMYKEIGIVNARILRID